MIRKIEAKDRYLAKHGWLSSYHLFSFAEYYDPSNMNFGVLRVFNDDTIDGESGFPPHAHKDMEIVTILLDGELTHGDTMGNREVIRKGEVQYMSAGTGVRHSEMNLSHDVVHLYQIWLMPREHNLTPTYDQKDFSQMEKNILVPVVSGEEQEGVIHIQSNATIYKAMLEEGKSIVYQSEQNRGVFVYIIEGILEINGVILTSGDQVRIEKEESLTLLAQEKTKFIFIDAAM